MGWVASAAGLTGNRLFDLPSGRCYKKARMGSRLRAFSLVVCVAALAGPAASATPSGAALRVACPQKTFLVGFYPKGEPSEHRPHVKIYTQQQFIALVLPKQLSFGRTCTAAHDSKTAWDGSRARTTGKRIVLKCRVAARTRLKGAPFAQPGHVYVGNNLFATLGRTGKVFLRAKIMSKGSSLRYDPRYCKKR